MRKNSLERKKIYIYRVATSSTLEGSRLLCTERDFTHDLKRGGNFFRKKSGGMDVVVKPQETGSIFLRFFGLDSKFPSVGRRRDIRGRDFIFLNYKKCVCFVISYV